jgi:hypothetical protein
MRFSFKENRTRGTCQQREAGNPGPVGMTRGEGWLRLEWLRDGKKPQIPPLRFAPDLDRKSGGAKWRDLRFSDPSWKCFSTERLCRGQRFSRNNLR